MDSNALVCPFCGQVVTDEDRLKEKYNGQQMTKQDFLQLPAMKSCKSNINTSGILLYFFGALNIVLQIIGKMLPIDGILMILLGFIWARAVSARFCVWHTACLM